MTTVALEGGFSNPPHDAAYAFRTLMDVIARPGRIGRLSGATPPPGLSTAAGTLLLTLADPDTPVFLADDLNTPDVRDWVTFHTGAPLRGPSHATFAVGGWDSLRPLDVYPIGTPEYPDRSTTLIVECEVLDATGTRLTGPGIEDSAMLPLPDPDFFDRNSRCFPLGLDFYFTCGDRIAGLPRSTRIG